MIRRLAWSGLLGSVTVLLAASTAQAEESSQNLGVGSLSIELADPNVISGVVYSLQEIGRRTAVVESGNAQGYAYLTPVFSSNGGFSLGLTGLSGVSGGDGDGYAAAGYTDTLSLTLTNQSSLPIAFVASGYVSDDETIDFGNGQDLALIGSRGATNISDTLGFLSAATTASLVYNGNTEVNNSASGQTIQVSSATEVEVVTYLNNSNSQNYPIPFTLAPGQTDIISLAMVGPASTQEGAFAPEPASLALLAIAAFPLLGIMRRRAIR
jgi:hypothetical protein